MVLDDIKPIINVPIEIEAQLDRQMMTVQQIVELSEGSVISTSRSAGENIDLYVGGVLVGCGEIVVIENTMGVRVADLLEEA